MKIKTCKNITDFKTGARPEGNNVILSLDLKQHFQKMQNSRKIVISFYIEIKHITLLYILKLRTGDTKEIIFATEYLKDVQKS